MRLHFSCYCHLIRIVLNMQDLVAMCSFVSVNYVSPQVHLPLKYDLLLPLAVACIYQHNLLRPPPLWDFSCIIIIDELHYKPTDINQCFKCLFVCLIIVSPRSKLSNQEFHYCNSAVNGTRSQRRICLFSL